MYFTREEEIAVVVCATLAQTPQDIVSLSDMSSFHGFPLPFLKKIMRTLKAYRLVTSKEGTFGGYRLAKSANVISLYDIIRAVTTGKSVKQQIFANERRTLCPLTRRCIPQCVRGEIVRTLSRSLKNVSVQKLIRSNI